MHFLIHSSEQGYCSPSYPTRIPTHNLEFCPLGFILHIETTMRMGIMDMIMMMMTGGSLGGAVAVAEADKVTPPCRGRHTNTLLCSGCHTTTRGCHTSGYQTKSCHTATRGCLTLHTSILTLCDTTRCHTLVNSATLPHYSAQDTTLEEDATLCTLLCSGCHTLQCFKMPHL